MFFKFLRFEISEIPEMMICSPGTLSYWNLDSIMFYPKLPLMADVLDETILEEVCWKLDWLSVVLKVVG